MLYHLTPNNNNPWTNNANYVPSTIDCDLRLVRLQNIEAVRLRKWNIPFLLSQPSNEIISWPSTGRDFIIFFVLITFNIRTKQSLHGHLLSFRIIWYLSFPNLVNATLRNFHIWAGERKIERLVINIIKNRS